MAPKWSILIDFGCFPELHSNFRDMVNLLNCNKYNAKTFFAISGLSFWHQKQIEIHFFQIPFIEIVFRILCCCCCCFGGGGKTITFKTHKKSSGRQNPPTPASVRRCQIRECRISQNDQKLSLGGPAGL